MQIKYPEFPAKLLDENIYVFIKIIVLLFADDMVIFGNSKEVLLLALNAFGKYCDDWKLTVNI